MKFYLITLLIFVITIEICISTDDEDGKVSIEKEDRNEHSERHGFDHDPHENYSDYDEDVLSGTSHHQNKNSYEAQKEMEELFRKIDSNNDSIVERNELFQHIIESMKRLHNETTAEEFEKVDKDKNNKISLDEYFIFEHHDPLEVLEKMINSDNSSSLLKLKKTLHYDNQRFKAADSDVDGFLKEHEYVLFKYPMFFPHMAHTVIHEYMEDLDSNQDGVVDKNEYVKHFHVDDNKDKTAKEKSLKKAEEDFVRYDKDSNGKIDIEELYAVIKPGYDDPSRSETEYLLNESDTNKDGKLTMQEIKRHSHTWLGSDLVDPENEDVYDEHDHHLEDEL